MSNEKETEMLLEGIERLYEDQVSSKLVEVRLLGNTLKAIYNVLLSLHNRVKALEERHGG